MQFSLFDICEIQQQHLLLHRTQFSLDLLSTEEIVHMTVWSMETSPYHWTKNPPPHNSQFSPSLYASCLFLVRL